MKKPDLILTSDWHLREDTPICRTDDFWNAQWEKVQQISELQIKFDCSVIHAGDLFHHWKPSPYLLTETIMNLPRLFYTIYGQHDLPQHNWELRQKCGLYNLMKAGWLETLEFGHWGSNCPGNIFKDINHSFPPAAAWHKFVWDGKKLPWPDCKENTALEILKKYPQYDLIVTGDHHKPFAQEYKGRILVNPGCLTRQTSAYATHLPRVYLWYAETNTVKIHYLKIKKDVVSREHIEKGEERDKRIEAFVERLSTEWDEVMSFNENLERFFNDNRIRKDIKELVYKAIDND